MQSRFPVFRLRPLANLIYSQLFYHCLGNLLITDTGTTLRIHDPWPPNRGKVYSKGYFKWSVELPTMTYRVFEL